MNKIYDDGRFLGEYEPHFIDEVFHGHKRKSGYKLDQSENIIHYYNKQLENGETYTGPAKQGK